MAAASKYLEGKTYPTSNLVIPSVYGCIELLHAGKAVRQPWDNKLLPANCLRPEVAEARQVVYEDMVMRWKTEMPENLKRFYMIATICDPRQKSLRFPGVTTVGRAQAREWFAAEYVSHWGPAPPETAPVATSPAMHMRTPKAPNHPQHAGATFMHFMENLAQLQEAESSSEEEDAIESEVEKYFDLPDEPMSTDVLQWWAHHETAFPLLSLMMARQYLGCPATSASAERLFSIAGRAYDDLRQAMDDRMLELLMWARVNREQRVSRHKAA